MTERKKSKSQILAAMHESAKGLRRIGLIDARRMREYDFLCIPRCFRFSQAKIKSIRDKHKLS